MSKSKLAKVLISLNFNQAKVQDLISRGHTVFTNMGAASGLFASPPVPLTTLKQDLDDLTTFTAAAIDGGKKDKVQRDKARKALEQNLSLLAAYVLKVADDDPAIVTTSGFVPAPPRKHSAPQPVAQPTIASIDQGNSGQLLVSVTPVPKASGYDVRHVPLANGVPAANWTTVTVTVAKTPIPINGLTPGTIYAFQVRALGKLGYTDWSDSATRMVI
jgi:hypothetical protein